MGKLRNIVLVLMGMLFIFTLTACGNKLAGKYVGDNGTWYSVLEIKGNKGKGTSDSDSQVNDKSALNIEIKSDKIMTINRQEVKYKLDKTGNILTDDGDMIFYKANSSEGKDLIKKHTINSRKLKEQTDFF
ncbi:hypothetical protein [Companilactobacillus kimchiensis]|nr:hypothetical protein [Companilactobacillus kimchiensis]